ncbi:unnamed protein product [Closterium sp. NIES-54]
MHLLPEVKCGPKAWTVLKELHTPITVVATLMLERELSPLRLSEGEPVQPVLDKMRDLYANLAIAGITYPEQTKCLKMLSLLPMVCSSADSPHGRAVSSLPVSFRSSVEMRASSSRSTRMHPTRIPWCLSSWYQFPPPVDPLPPQGPAPSHVSQVDPPPLVEPLVISSDTFGPAKRGDPAADDTASTRCSPH